MNKLKITTTVRSDDLSLLANGIRNALLKRHNKLRLGVDSNGWLWIADDDRGETVCVDLDGQVEKFEMEE